jgi:hypothetical protein
MTYKPTLRPSQILGTAAAALRVVAAASTLKVHGATGRAILQSLSKKVSLVEVLAEGPKCNPASER